MASLRGKRFRLVLWAGWFCCFAGYSAGSAAEPEIGAFSGGYSPTDAADFEAWVGRKSAYNVDFFSYEAFTGSNTMSASAGWDVGVWVSADQPDRNMLFSVPLATLQDESLSDVAAGTYDSSFLATAQVIAKYYPKAIIRLGWEFNEAGLPWTAVGRPQDYIDAFRHVVAIFRSVSPDFVIDWCGGLGIQGIAAEDAYPGDDVVDVIGMDVYDDWNVNPTPTDPLQRWYNLQNEDHGLIWQKQFAAAHNKPMSYPEWAVNHDEPYFIAQMYNWIMSNNVAYASYWDSNSSFQGRIDDDQYPGVSATYKFLFGLLGPY